MKLAGKVAVVTGGAKGIGKCICELFATEGAKVICADMNQTETKGSGIDFFKLNVCDTASCTDFFKAVTEKYGRIDILVNNAGITRDSMTWKMTDEQWNQVIDVNLKGLFNLVRHIGPYMEKQGEGSIINLSSIVGIMGNIGQANYSATKAGVIGLTKSWAKEFARKGAQVRVNAIAPGYIMTDMLKTVPEDLLDKFAKQTMLGSLGTPEDIAKTALFFASDDSRYITAQVIAVDGGLRI